MAYKNIIHHFCLSKDKEFPLIGGRGGGGERGGRGGCKTALKVQHMALIQK